MITLTAEERDRMEATHQPGQSITPRAGEPRQLVCFGCGMAWPCPGRRLLDEPEHERASWRTMLSRIFQ